MARHVGANQREKRREKRSGTARRAFSIAKWCVLAGALCGLGGFGAQRLWIWMNSSPAFTVHKIEVRGARTIGEKDIVRLAGILPGARMLDVRTSAAGQAVLANCRVRRADVARSYPDKVVITVEERSPVAMVNLGRIYTLDRDGVVLPLAPGACPELPLVSGVSVAGADSVGKSIAPRQAQRLRELLDASAQTDDSLMRRVSQIDLADESVIRLKMENCPTVAEIDGRDVGAGLRRLRALLGLLADNPEGMPLRIDLCYGNLAFAQW